MRSILLAFAIGFCPGWLLAQEEPETPAEPTLETEPTLEEEPLEALDLTDTTSVVQDTVWLTSFGFGLNFNQAAFSDNWIGGGINSVAFSSFLNYQAHYDKDGWSWDSEVDMLYGIISTRNQGSRKSQDRIFIDSKVGRSISENWNGFFSLNFLTQFGPGYRYEEDALGVEQEFLVSKFMSPGFLTASIGFEYDPNEYFTLRLSPLSSRLTFVSDTAVFENVEARYGVDLGEQVRRELYALQIQADYGRNITETISLKTRYLMFANYDDFSISNWDHRLELLFSAQITRFINVSFASILLYDRDQTDDPQISQSLGVGVLLQRERAFN